MTDLTREQIMAMKPGGELDALVADKVINLFVVNGKVAPKPPECSPEKWADWDDLPHYSTDIAAAWEVLETVRKQGWLIKVQEIPDGIPWLMNGNDEPDMPVYRRVSVEMSYIRGRTSRDANEVRKFIHTHIFVFADKGPADAICRAGLLAVMGL